MFLKSPESHCADCGKYKGVMRNGKSPAAGVSDQDPACRSTATAAEGQPGWQWHQ